MNLVAYSDSEGSEDEKPTKPANKTVPKKVSAGNFAVDKSNPTKIRVNLSQLPPATSERPDGEPTAKRPRVGGGAFSGFNSMLPAPKRDIKPEQSQNGTRAATRKVFSLKTGAEPSFSRESDAELRQLFTEQDASSSTQQQQDTDTTIPSIIPKPQSISDPAPPSTSRPFLFKPLSVARNSKKKKPVSSFAKQPIDVPKHAEVKTARPELPAEQPVNRKNVSLFSSGTTDEPPVDVGEEEQEDDIVEILPDEDEGYNGTDDNPTGLEVHAQPHTLDTIASDLNLSAADRRQLFGRSGANSSKASHVLNFNTDTEYAANQAFLSTTDAQAQQHNPVRAIASGKHSLKQLVASAQGQKEALEESFAAGKRNKKEAGSKYGW